MKKVFALMFVLNVSILLYSQDCKNYYYLQNNKTVEMSLYDKKGGSSGKLVYRIADVNNANSLTTASVQSEMFDKKGRSIAKGNSVMKCNGGVMMIDMKLSIPTAQAEQFSKANAKTDNFYIEYPVNMNKGDLLKEGNMSMDMDNNGMQQSITMTIFDRKVEDKETITTSAGSWDCFKISYKTKMNVRIMGIGVPMNMVGTEWYAPNFGIVKTNSTHGSTEITSIK